MITNQFLIENASGENEELDPLTREEVQAKERERLRRMTYYCHTQDCLRQYILSPTSGSSPPTGVATAATAKGRWRTRM